LPKNLTNNLTGFLRRKKLHLAFEGKVQNIIHLTCARRFPSYQTKELFAFV